MFGETLHCGELIKRLNDALGRKANNTLMCNDVTLSQIKVLATISEAADETITLKELEKHFEVKQATMAGIAARLEKNGMIEGFYDSNDKRIKHVKLTAKGEEICKTARASMDENERELLKALNDDEKGQLATVYKGNIIKNLIMDCQSYTKYRPNETTGGIFVSWRRKEELPTGA